MSKPLPMHRTLKAATVGRGDLLRALARQQDPIAPWFGFSRVAATPAPAKTPPPASKSAPAPTPVPAIEDHPLAPLPFWYATHYEALSEAGCPPDPEPAQTLADFHLPPTPAQTAPLAPWSALQPRLRQALKAERPGAELDVPAIVEKASRVQLFDAALPRLRRAGWGARLHLVLDRCDRLIPYWQDQQQVAECLRTRVPAYALTQSVVLEGEVVPRLVTTQQPLIVTAGDWVLILGDLGILARDGIAGRTYQRAWRRFGQRLRAAGASGIALLPCAPGRVPPALARWFTVVPWQRLAAGAPVSPAANAARVAHLLTLASAAVRLEPGLLRDLRLLLGAEFADAGLESEVWQHPALASNGSVAASFDHERVGGLRQAFAALAASLRARVLRAQQRWRGTVHPVVWCEELLALGEAVAEASRKDAWLRGQLAVAEQYLVQLGERIRHGRGVMPPERGMREYWAGVAARVSPVDVASPVARVAMHRLFREVLGDEYAKTQVSDPSLGSDASAGPERRLVLVQRGGDVGISAVAQGHTVNSPVNAPLTRGISAVAQGGAGQERSYLGALRSSDGAVALQAAVSFWRVGHAPSWADRWGYDQFGAWVTITMAGADGARVEQRMRWIVPGEFTMGSPADEPGRHDHEGPPHRVRISHGYWLFDTPVTQAFWSAVMGENPSKFRTPDRPVECVDYEDCERFLAALRQRLPGLLLTLPSEAEWEYACRAGTREATYAGSMEIQGEYNAPVLDGIAWYGGNSGVDFELDNGFDNADWPEKRRPDGPTGTHPVGRKQPNPWGLYDMLGNVWEWCRDGMRGYSEDHATDPQGPVEPGSRGVIRGGAWVCAAHYVRAAHRYWFGPGFRFDFLGLRPALVQAGAEPALAPRGQAARRRAAPSFGVVASPMAQVVGEAALPLPDTAMFTLVTDRSRLRMERLECPSWASAIGRDSLGLWTEISVPAGDDSESVVQRLRWCPPGEFMMGSPDDEDGRFDNEGPRHPVVLTQGFWLFDTPCTQALWCAVMDDNPSQFVSPDRPVENVSYEQCEHFLGRVATVLPGLNLTLPSEAEWEYACRAGTETATYCATGQGLEAIAWHENNSWDGFELNNGFELTNGRPAGTRPVKQRAPNPWGVFDMLGNVWEWCRDGRRRYVQDKAFNPLGPVKTGGRRVVRGGAWGNPARHVRAAYRVLDRPGNRVDNLGLRPALVSSQVPVVSGGRQGGL